MINFALAEAEKKLARKLVFNGLNLEVGTANVSDFKIKNTLLCQAAIWGDDELLNFLLEKGADLNKRDQIGKTPLMYAANNNNLSTVNLLIKMRPRFYLDENERKAVEEFAIRNDHQSIINLLKTEYYKYYK